MEQKSSSPDRGPELPPITPVPGGEMGPSAPSPEVQLGGAVERKEQRGEAAHATGVASDDSTIVLPPPAALPVTDDGAATPAQQTISDPPSVANDDDLIEKEWVDRAKRIIVETRDDPFQREREVTKLQADYLLKRYGRELGSL